MVTFFRFLLIGYSYRFDLVVHSFIVQLNRFNFTLHLLDFFLESETLLLEKAELRGELDDILVSFDFDIDVSVGLLGKYQIVAHFF
jgi:hypothetical protein